MGILSNFFGKKMEANATAKLEVSMSCVKCVKRIDELMAANKAVVETKIDLPSKMVFLRYDKNKTTVEALIHSIEEIGFDVILK